MPSTRLVRNTGVTMFISRLFIKNFRNLRHLDVEIGQGVTCFIGENNSGKTNLFYALRLVLDGNISAQRRRLQPEDLAAGLTFAKPEHVLISVEFSDFPGGPTKRLYLSLPSSKTARPESPIDSGRKRPYAIPLNKFPRVIPSQNSRSMTMFGR